MQDFYSLVKLKTIQIVLLTLPSNSRVGAAPSPRLAGWIGPGRASYTPGYLRARLINEALTVIVARPTALIGTEAVFESIWKVKS
jgi:hypothetical protein